MKHPRTKIRDAAVAALKGIADLQQRVFPARVYPLKPHELPGMCVYTTGEESALISRDTVERVTQLTVEIYVQGGDFDEKVDALAMKAELAISQDEALNALTKDIQITATDKDLMKEGENVVCVCILLFTTKYTTSPTTADIID